MIHVFLNVYADEHPQREQELRFVEGLWRTRTDITLHVYSGRPTFDDVFAISRRVVSASDISVVLNSDCYLDLENTALLEKTIVEGEFWCLSRWDIRKGQSPLHHGYEFSQDAWAWRGVLDQHLRAPFTAGTSACDGALVARAHALGYAVKNPSVDVKVWHFHESGVRRWQDKPLCVGPHKFAEPHALLTPRRDKTLTVVTLAVKPHYYELAHNLALSAWLHGTDVHVMTDEIRGNPIFKSEKLVLPASLGCEDIWRLKPTAIHLFEKHVGALAFVDSDCLMLNSSGPALNALGDFDFHQPTERCILQHERWAFPVPAREIARRYGIPDENPLPQINGGFFCWRPGEISNRWLAAFEDALAWCTKHLGIRREECAMMLANAKLRSPQHYSDACLSLWVTGNRVYSPNNTLFTCSDEYGKNRRPTFGHYGSANTVPRREPKDFGVEYRRQVHHIKEECLRRGLPAKTVYFAESLTHPVLP